MELLYAQFDRQHVDLLANILALNIGAEQKYKNTHVVNAFCAF